MRKDLFLRTEVLPEEIPILFSNKAVYLSFSKSSIESLFEIKNTLHKLITVPLFFQIPKSQKEKRKIALLHPLAQIQAFDYILKYEQLITSFCKNSPFSVRSPIKRNIPKIKMREIREKELEKMEEEFNFTDKISVTSDEDKILFYNYFSYNKHKRIQDLYNSPKFNRDKYKFSYFLKLDIQRCFPSIYTHSLAWAIFGDKSLAKTHASKRDLFPNATDNISQKINFNETHGIVVGPEFSRVIAELLLTRIDINLQLSLNKNQNLSNKKDYSLYRFIDDYFLFAHKKEDIKLIEEALKRELDKHNLTLNVWKSELQTKPIEVNDNAIIQLKKILKEFDLDKKMSLYLKNENNKDATTQIRFKDYKGTRFHWDNLFSKMETLISNHYDSKSKIVNFFLKSIRSSIHFDGHHHFVIKNALEIISNIYTLDINNKSTNYLIAIYYKLLAQTKTVKNTITNKMRETKVKEDLSQYKTTLDNLIQIEEAIFHHSFNILKNNINEIENMYDLLVFMKLLDKKLAPSFLCEILSKHKKSYFVCCSIANYILKSHPSSLNMRFLTVSKKLLVYVNSYIDNYVPKGADEIILEGDFFYFLNDFSKYPGFLRSAQDKLSRRLKREINKTINTTEQRNSERKRIWKSLTRYSYYDWNSNTDNFIRKITKKSSNTRLESTFDY